MTRNYDLAGVCQHHLRSFILLVAVCIFLASCGGGSNTNSNATPIVASVMVTPGSPSIAMNTTQQFTAVAKDASGNTMSGLRSPGRAARPRSRRSTAALGWPLAYPPGARKSQPRRAESQAPRCADGDSTRNRDHYCDPGISFDPGERKPAVRGNGKG